MARLVLDDSLFLDPRFRALARSVGEDSAIAKCVRAFRIAQRYWSDNQQLVPEHLWLLEDCDALVEFHLADKRPEGIYVRGSEDYFDWLFKKRQAGSKGGKATKTKWLSTCPSTATALLQHTPSTALVEPGPSVIVSAIVNNSTETSPKFSPTDWQLASDWLGALWDGKGKISTESAAEVVSQLVRIDGYTHEDLRKALAFVQGDDFWKANAISPAGLRKKGKNGLMKIQNIMAKLKAEEDQNGKGYVDTYVDKPITPVGPPRDPSEWKMKTSRWGA